MNETRKYLDHLTKVSADNIPATVESRNDDGTYMVRTVAGRALRRAAKNNPADEFAINSRVTLIELSNTRNVIGAQPVIQSRGPREQRGLSQTTPHETRTGDERSLIATVDPDPLVLVAGGDAADQMFIGESFTEPVTYVVRGTTTAIDVEDDEAPEVTASKITMHVRAPFGAPRGTFDAITSGARARRALTIRAPKVTPSLFVWTVETFDDADPPRLVRLHPDTLAVLDIITPAVGVNYGTGIAQVDATLLGFAEGSASSRIERVNLATHEALSSTVNASGLPGSGGCVVGSEYWAPRTDGFPSDVYIHRFNSAGVELGSFLLAAAFGGGPKLASNGGVVWGTGGDAGTLWRYDVEAETFFDGTPADSISQDSLAVTDTGVWVLGSAQPLHALKYDRDTLALLIDANIAIEWDVALVAHAGGRVFIVMSDASGAGDNNSRVFVGDDATGVFAQTGLLVNFRPDYLAAGTGAIYLTAESSATIYRIDAEPPYEITNASPIDPAPAEGLGPPFVSRRVL